MPVTDAEEILWRVEQCLKDAEVSSLLGLAWLRGPKGANHPRAVQATRQFSILQRRVGAIVHAFRDSFAAMIRRWGPELFARFVMVFGGLLDGPIRRRLVSTDRF